MNGRNGGVAYAVQLNVGFEPLIFVPRAAIAAPGVESRGWGYQWSAVILAGFWSRSRRPSFAPLRLLQSWHSGSVSQNIQVPPASSTVCSRKASMSWAAPVIWAALGGKQYSPGSSGAAAFVVNGIPWDRTR
jgi:hypothetical protein